MKWIKGFLLCSLLLSISLLFTACREVQECGFELVLDNFRVEYLVGETVEFDKIKIKVKYTDNSESIVSADFENFKSQLDITKSGVYEVTIQYGEFEDYTFEIRVYEGTLEKAEMELNSLSFVYSGEEITPLVSRVSLGEVCLNSETDYSIEYFNNIDAGKGLVKITGKGKYIGELTQEFSILPKTIFLQEKSSYATLSKEYDGLNNFNDENFCIQDYF